MPWISVDRGQGTKLPTKGRILRACRVPFSRYSLLINNWISWYISANKQVKKGPRLCVHSDREQTLKGRVKQLMQDVILC